jgi:hypothetical protein
MTEENHNRASKLVGPRAVSAHKPDAHVAPQGTVPCNSSCNVERLISTVSQGERGAAVNRATMLDGEESGHSFKCVIVDLFQLADRWLCVELEGSRLSLARSEDQHRALD